MENSEMIILEIAPCSGSHLLRLPEGEDVYGHPESFDVFIEEIIDRAVAEGLVEEASYPGATWRRVTELGPQDVHGDPARRAIVRLPASWGEWLLSRWIRCPERNRT